MAARQCWRTDEPDRSRNHDRESGTQGRRATTARIPVHPRSHDHGSRRCRAQIHRCAFIAQMEGTTPVRRLGGLFEHQQQLGMLDLPALLLPEQHRDRRQTDLTRIGSRLEVLDPQTREHAHSLP